ncbi:hypothetical protein ACIQZB_33360 [Streptomyces sp. NPDC097727]|uniref:hypothetical protein n=1 Tax=Streptomyces sp. NPDC097727 TaxID=3366092 RepID=UPI0038039A16
MCSTSVKHAHVVAGLAGARAADAVALEARKAARTEAGSGTAPGERASGKPPVKR